jgi:hypothetical protein
MTGLASRRVDSMREIGGAVGAAFWVIFVVAASVR